MPRGDRTGPDGLGPMTGRDTGYCSGYRQPGFASFGRGYGRGAGFGRGFGRRTPTSPAGIANTQIDELQRLKNEAVTIKADLESINARIRELEKNG